METLKKLSYAATLAALALFAGCHKTKNEEIVPDKDLQSSVDVSRANMVITDIDMMCSYVGENDLMPKFYVAVPGTPVASMVVPTRDQNANYLFLTFNNTQCVDGRLRSGTVAMNYAYTNPNAKYYRDYQFEGKVSLTNYQVDGWKVLLNNTFFITNKLPAPNYDPKTTKLSWTLKGDFTLQHPTDPSKNMRCYVDLTKTLSNSTDPAVFATSKQASIKWALAVVEYKGTVWGQTAGNVPFNYTIDEKHPLVRDFSCYPDKAASVTSVSSSSIAVRYDEFHPFTRGLASLTTGQLYPRQISYGDEQNEFWDVAKAPKILPQQCDNKGIVTIKGISYAIDFTE